MNLNAIAIAHQRALVQRLTDEWVMCRDEFYMATNEVDAAEELLRNMILNEGDE